MTGSTISHYQILEKLGEGGMGVVYRAHDTRLNRDVALKVLPPDKVADPERQRRFVQEARAASGLNHPGIVTIYDIDSDDGVCFISMEYVPGRTHSEGTTIGGPAFTGRSLSHLRVCASRFPHRRSCRSEKRQQMTKSIKPGTAPYANNR